MFMFDLWRLPKDAFLDDAMGQLTWSGSIVPLSDLGECVPLGRPANAIGAKGVPLNRDKSRPT